MQINVEYEYNPAFAKRLYREFLWKTQREYVVWSVAIVAGAAAMMRYHAYELYASFMLGVVAVWWYGWWSGSRRVVAEASLYGAPVLRVTADVAGVTVSSSEAITQFTWQAVACVYQLKSGLVLSRRRGGSGAVIPRNALGTEALATIERWARDGGAHVR